MGNAKEGSEAILSQCKCLYMREATAFYTILAADDKDALKKMHEIIKNGDLKSGAEDFCDIDSPFNYSGSFTLARGDEVPDEDDDMSIVVLREDFGESY